MQTKGITVQFEGEHKKLIPTWKQVRNASKKVVRKKDSNSTEKRKCKVKYTKNKTKSAIHGWNRI